jgi:hypothetical protein
VRCGLNPKCYAKVLLGKEKKKEPAQNKNRDMKETNNKDSIIDWVYLSNDTKIEPLWECLHDADLK